MFGLIWAKDLDEGPKHVPPTSDCGAFVLPRPLGDTRMLYVQQAFSDARALGILAHATSH